MSQTISERITEALERRSFIFKYRATTTFTTPQGYRVKPGDWVAFTKSGAVCKISVGYDSLPTASHQFSNAAGLWSACREDGNTIIENSEAHRPWDLLPRKN